MPRGGVAVSRGHQPRDFQDVSWPPTSEGLPLACFPVTPMCSCARSRAKIDINILCPGYISLGARNRKEPQLDTLGVVVHPRRSDP